MLVFTRKSGEGLVIGEEIEVRILSVGKEQVRVGITAPRRIAVHRQEVYELICRQNRLASQSQLPSDELLSELKRSRSDPDNS